MTLGQKNMTQDASSFTQNRDLLHLLADDSFMTGLVRETGERNEWWEIPREWKRTFGCFDPDKDKIATLIFESQNNTQEIVSVEVWRTIPGTDSQFQVLRFQEDIGWMKIVRFPADSKLKTLPRLLQHCENTRILRYRPGKRCTLRTQDPADQRSVFIKIFPDERGRDYYNEQQKIWHVCKKGYMDFTVAEPLKWDATTKSFWQSEVPGEGIEKILLSSNGPQLAYRVGKSLATIPNSTVQPDAVLNGQMQLQRSLKYAKDLCRRIPRLTVIVESLLTHLTEMHSKYMNRKMYPIHGSPHVHQWLVDGGRFGLVDFDRISFGDPELDVATFITEIDFEDKTSVPVAQINEQFINGYEMHLGPLNMNLLNAYRCHKRLAKALKAARSIEPYGDEKAEKHLMFAAECVTGELI